MTATVPICVPLCGTHRLPASWCVFTNISTTTFVLGLWAGRMSISYALGAQFVVFSCAAFHAGALIDATCFARMRRRRGYSFIYFHAGNVALHILPVLYVLRYPPRTHLLWTCTVLACLAHEAWAALVTRGTFNLDEVYVPMSRVVPNAWHRMTLFGFACQFVFTWWVAPRA